MFQFLYSWCKVCQKTDSTSEIKVPKISDITDNKEASIKLKILKDNNKGLPENRFKEVVTNCADALCRYFGDSLDKETCFLTLKTCLNEIFAKATDKSAEKQNIVTGLNNAIKLLQVDNKKQKNIEKEKAIRLIKFWFGQGMKEKARFLREGFKFEEPRVKWKDTTEIFGFNPNDEIVRSNMYVKKICLNSCKETRLHLYKETKLHPVMYFLVNDPSYVPDKFIFKARSVFGTTVSGSTFSVGGKPMNQEVNINSAILVSNSGFIKLLDKDATEKLIKEVNKAANSKKDNGMLTSFSGYVKMWQGNGVGYDRLKNNV